MICMKNVRFSSCPGAKVGRQGPPGSARAQPCFRFLIKLEFQLVLPASSSHIVLALGHFFLVLVNDFVN